ncbi:AAA family ATPase [Candidatus Absconditicoccus praedator]|uniref:AAA family ATPase n=1 Tax=Candidatus Absconditicoccus praedator TaxID=2735562 RepID=UPI001E5CF54E|nr:MoxR family ATPase [Candidatus Absconditicoccus praedator]UFX82703.1 AAA family ATPase [Candidatus Absconditicoccus praedator]
MFWFFVILILVILVLIIFLYSIWKDEELDSQQSNKLDDSYLKETENISYIDSSVFSDDLSDLSIKNEDIIEVKNQLNNTIIGMDGFLNALLVNLFSNGHILVEGLPGLAKTKTIKTLSKIMDFDFKRVQFTPDMMPSDIVGVEIYNQKDGQFYINKGPVFTDILLADEINRTTPKVQSALLEAMEEKQVSIGGYTHEISNPFFVLATQNPVEQEGTYTLPEAQVDRFLFKAIVNYPGKDDESKIISSIENEKNITTEKALDKNKFFEIIKNIENVHVGEDVKDYIARLVTCTRQEDSRVVYGASPRGSISIYKASKVIAFFQNRDYVIHEDVQKIAILALRHRLILSYQAMIEGYTPDQLLIEKLKKVTLE